MNRRHWSSSPTTVAAVTVTCAVPAAVLGVLLGIVITVQSRERPTIAAHPAVVITTATGVARAPLTTPDPDTTTVPTSEPNPGATDSDLTKDDAGDPLDAPAPVAPPATRVPAPPVWTTDGPAPVGPRTQPPPIAAPPSAVPPPATTTPVPVTPEPTTTPPPSSAPPASTTTGPVATP